MEIIRRNTDYGIRALVFMAQKPIGEIFSLSDLAAQIEVPLDFLYKIFRKLAEEGLVTAHRGANGGFSLKKETEKITVKEVVEILQGPLAINQCFLSNKPCSYFSKCFLKKRWRKVQEEVEKILSGLTLEELAKGGKHFV